MKLIEKIKKLKLARLAFLLLIVYFLKGAFLSFYNNSKLGRYGVPGYAIISPEKYVGARRHGPGKYYFTFELNGTSYRGVAEKEADVFVGDTIKIFYLPDDPSVNCSYQYAKGIFFQQLIED
ncbi:hypothetical protein [Aquiflexum gelatinilyticum]|uniref:DUF3592 domain-containing protein n=1 Tax=Aquiflexum gelatinilyticum TaxID=2961943 RepID=A0A9X2T1Y4_9BACT|nr:hypothetical protein [Aquiflexum gelatinilyticum]MCR9017283.1 hypothetical protein [Aquiflexum gelatinilyticum]